MAALWRKFSRAAAFGHGRVVDANRRTGRAGRPPGAGGYGRGRPSRPDAAESRSADASRLIVASRGTGGRAFFSRPMGRGPRPDGVTNLPLSRAEHRSRKTV